MLYAVPPEKHGFHSGGSVGDSAPSFWIFWIHPWSKFELSSAHEKFGVWSGPNSHWIDLVYQHGRRLINN